MIVDDSFINGIEAAKKGLPLNTQIMKCDRVEVRRRPKLDEERYRADLMNLSILIRQYPEKAKEYIAKYLSAMV